MIEPKSCVQELISMECIDRSVLILYPYGLSNEPILKDNIPKMTKAIREYIKESEMYREIGGFHYNVDNIVYLDKK